MRGHRVSALVNRTRQETFDSEEQEGTVSRQDEGEGTKRELRADATRSGPGSPARPRPPVPSPPLPARSLYDEKAREVSAGHRESLRGAAGALQDAGAGGGGGGPDRARSSHERPGWYRHSPCFPAVCTKTGVRGRVCHRDGTRTRPVRVLCGRGPAEVPGPP